MSAIKDLITELNLDENETRQQASTQLKRVMESLLKDTISSTDTSSRHSQYAFAKYSQYFS